MKGNKLKIPYNFGKKSRKTKYVVKERLCGSVISTFYLEDFKDVLKVAFKIFGVIDFNTPDLEVLMKGGKWLVITENLEMRVDNL